MSRQAHLPPRCPFQKKPLTSPVQDHFTTTLHQHNPLPPRHHKSISQSSILEEQPAWLDELLNESDSNSGGMMHRRSASDSLTLLDGLVSFEGFDKFDETESNASCESDSSSKTNCIYGPNSPRGKSNITFAENAIVSALSEYVSPNPLQYLDRCISVSGATQSELASNVSGAANDVNAEAKAMKRLDSGLLCLFQDFSLLVDNVLSISAFLLLNLSIFFGKATSFQTFPENTRHAPYIIANISSLCFAQGQHPLV